MSNNNFTLFNLTNMWLDFKNKMDQIDEPTEEEKEIEHDTFEALDASLQDKVNACASIINGWELEVDQANKMAEIYKKMASTRVKKIKRLKQYIIDDIKRAEEQDNTFTSHLGNVKIKKNGGLRKLTIHCKTYELPRDCVKVKEEPDTKAIRKLIAEGGEAAEKTDKWTLEPRGEHLYIEGMIKGGK